ncbi:MAG: DUF4276 family protein [Pseudomonadales bacterium]|nr:DUF4276 family protein [Pseudomonadales bacterium]
MKEVVIYLEGGGDIRETQAQLRQGMDAFLRSLRQFADSRGWRWRLVALGGREQAFRRWNRAVANDTEVLHILLVDSEEEVTCPPCEHLRRREGDGWTIKTALEPQVHLMAQCMEAWLVADPDAMAGYYGKNFESNRLSRRKNLEEEPKQSIYEALGRATQKTSKGAYGKINHASALLARVDPGKARERCPHCERLFATLEGRFGGP